MTEPRIAPGGPAQTGRVVAAFERLAARRMGTRSLNLFTTLGRHRRLFWPWLRFAGRLMPRGRLSRRQTELVILRVANLRGCEYELEHHRRLGRRAGLTPEEIERVAQGPGAAGWSASERAILAATDEIDAGGDIGDETWRELSAHLDEPRLIELCMLAGHYEMLATTIAALRIQPDLPR